jgi:hypothetical protein
LRFEPDDLSAFLAVTCRARGLRVRTVSRSISGVRSVLVVSTVEDGEADLRAQVGDADRIKVVVPVVRQGVLDWLANDERAFSHAERVAERTAEQLPGETVEAVAGEANVELAIRDALATFAADEIVVAVRPEDEEGLVESRATADVSKRSVDGVPVRLVVISGS